MSIRDDEKFAELEAALWQAEDRLYRVRFQVVIRPRSGPPRCSCSRRPRRWIATSPLAKMPEARLNRPAAQRCRP